MNVSAIQYVADQHGQTTGVFIPIDLWRKIQEQLAANDPAGQPTAWEVLDSLAGSIAAPADWAANALLRGVATAARRSKNRCRGR